jgi:hypothetical protein
MPVAEFYHLYIKASDLDPTDAALVKKLDLAKDWIRYGDCCWLLYTTSDAAKWNTRLADFVKERNGHFFIIRVDISKRQGWMPKRVWTWLREKRDE